MPLPPPPRCHRRDILRYFAMPLRCAVCFDFRHIAAFLRYYAAIITLTLRHIATPHFRR